MNKYWSPTWINQKIRNHFYSQKLKANAPLGIAFIGPRSSTSLRRSYRGKTKSSPWAAWSKLSRNFVVIYRRDSPRMELQWATSRMINGMHMSKSIRRRRCLSFWEMIIGSLLMLLSRMGSYQFKKLLASNWQPRTKSVKYLNNSMICSTKRLKKSSRSLDTWINGVQNHRYSLCVLCLSHHASSS